MGHIGFGELVLILLIILVIFGAGKLPQVMKSLGEGMSSFRKAAQDDGKVAQSDQPNSLPVNNLASVPAADSSNTSAESAEN